MSKVSMALGVVTVAFLAAAGTAGGERNAVAGTAGLERSATTAGLPAGLSVRVPSGWHVLRGWLSDVRDPAPRLAVASFPARLSRRTCECGIPNVVHLPPRGAFVFVWEYLRPARRQLVATPRRPARFALAPGRGVRQTCNGPTDELAFRQVGRVFQVEVYLGPRAPAPVRSRTEAILDSLRVAPAT